MTEETMTFEGGTTYTQRWATHEVPEQGSTYRVLRDEWSDDYTVRTIHAWVSTDDA